MSERYAGVKLHRSATHGSCSNVRCGAHERIRAGTPTWLQKHVWQAKAGMVEGVGRIGTDLQVGSIAQRE